MVIILMVNTKGFIDSPDEECDCGQADQCKDVDPCCTPPLGIGNDKGCKYRRETGAECSYHEDKCCSMSCQILSAVFKKRCNPQDLCRYPSYCNGKTKDCPPSRNYKNGKICRGGIGKCQDGVCKNAVCSRSRMTECACADFKSACYLCCSLDGLCHRATVFGIKQSNGKPYFVPDGEPCSGGFGECLRGYCVMMVKRDDDGKVEETTAESYGLRYIGYIILMVFVVDIIIFVPLVIAFVVVQNYRQNEAARYNASISIRSRT